MNRGDQQLRPGPIISTAFLLALLLISVLANLVLAMALLHRAETPAAVLEARRALPCEAIPIKLVLEDPVCADKLLSVMNVSNVRVIARNGYVDQPAQVGSARTSSPE